MVNLDVINMADWLASRHAISTVRAAFFPNSRPSRAQPGMTGCLTLTPAQPETILDHTSLPDDLVARLIIEKFGRANSRFMVVEVDVLQDKVEEAAHYTKGFVRRRLMGVAKKLLDIRSTMSNGARHLFLR